MRSAHVAGLLVHGSERNRTEPHIKELHLHLHIAAREAGAGVATLDQGVEAPSEAHHVKSALLLLRWCQIQ